MIKIMSRLGIGIFFLALVLSLNTSCQNFFWSHTGGSVAPPDTCYGYLYNWFAVDDSREITSSATWEVPSTTQRTTLYNHIGGTSSVGGKLKELGLTRWNSPNGGATDEYNFSGVGAGERTPAGNFSSIKGVALFVNSNQQSASNQYGWQLTSASNNWTNRFVPKESGWSVRLVRTATAPEQLLDDGTFLDDYTGNDGKTYSVVKIGTQAWTAENLEETQYRNLDVIPNVTDGTTWAGLSTGAWCVYENNNAYKCK